MLVDMSNLKNVKTVEVIKPVFGLVKGDKLSRSNKGDVFSYYDETAGEGYSETKSVTISEPLVDEEYFKVVEEFQAKSNRSKSFYKKQYQLLTDKVEALEKELDDANCRVATLEMDKIMADKTILNSAKYSESSKLDQIDDFLGYKIDSYESRFNKLKSIYDSRPYSTQYDEEILSEMTVLDNLIKFAKYIKSM